MRRIAFDLDETLGVPLIEGNVIVGFQVRPGCLELLRRLRAHFVLCLWPVSLRRYLDKVLSYGLGKWFGDLLLGRAARLLEGRLPHRHRPAGRRQPPLPGEGDEA